MHEGEAPACNVCNGFICVNGLAGDAALLLRALSAGVLFQRMCASIWINTID